MNFNHRKTQRFLKNLVALVIFLVTLRLFFLTQLFLASIGLIVFLLFTRIIDFSNKYIKNTELPVVLDEMIKLINSAESEINIFTGKINPEIYGHDDVFDAIIKAKERGVSITIITNFKQALSKAKSFNENKIFDLAKKRRIQIYDFGDKANDYNHFIVVDSIHYRMENDIHNDTGEEEIKRPASIQYRNFWAKNLNSKFKHLIDMNKVSKVSLDLLQESSV